MYPRMYNYYYYITKTYGELCSSTMAVTYSSGAYKDQKIVNYIPIEDILRPLK